MSADVETVRARLVKVRDEIVGLTRGMPADVALDYLGGIDDDIAKLDALVARVAEAEKALREIIDLAQLPEGPYYPRAVSIAREALETLEPAEEKT